MPEKNESSRTPCVRQQPARRLAVIVLFAVAASVGCWEQMDDGKWFPQMKRQQAVQAFEIVTHRDQLEGFTPPADTVPVGGSALPDLVKLAMADQDALANPNAATLASLKNGELLYGRYCSTCHGVNGLGDGPVAAASPFAPKATGPFPGILPLGGPYGVAKLYSEGHIYTTISLGRGRMPNYGRIPAEQRWDVINYLRAMFGQGVRQ